MAYKEVSKHHIHSNPPLGISVSVDISRELTDDETWEISKATDVILTLMQRNTLLMDKVYMNGIANEKKDLLDCFPHPFYVKEIPNGYSPGSINPWFIVTTEKGPIEIGWRKHVISIDWQHSDIRDKADILFSAEDTTKDYKSIHAWGYAKAKEYITKLLS